MHVLNSYIFETRVCRSRLQNTFRQTQIAKRKVNCCSYLIFSLSRPDYMVLSTSYCLTFTTLCQVMSLTAAAATYQRRYQQAPGSIEPHQMKHHVRQKETEAKYARRKSDADRAPPPASSHVNASEHRKQASFNDLCMLWMEQQIMRDGRKKMCCT